MPFAIAQTYVYPLLGQTTGEVEAAEMPVDDSHSLPRVGYTGAYGRRTTEVEKLGMENTPEGRIYRAAQLKIALPTWNAPPSNFAEIEVSTLLYADFPSATIEDHLRGEKMHINGYTLDQAVSADPSIIDRIAAHPAYQQIRAVVWLGQCDGKSVKLITLTNNAYIHSIVCQALPSIHVTLPNRHLQLQRERRIRLGR